MQFRHRVLSCSIWVLNSLAILEELVALTLENKTLRCRHGNIIYSTVM